MSKLRVGMVVDPWDLPFNGTVVSARRFVEALSDDVSFSIFMTPSRDVPLPAQAVLFDKLSIPGVNHIIDRMQAPVAKPNRTTLDEAMASLDVLHVQYPFFLAYGAIRAARRAGIPVISSFHVQPENILKNLKLNFAPLVPVLYKLFVRAFYNAADHVVVPSQFAADLLVSHGTERPITVISNGITPRFLKGHTIDKPIDGPPFLLLSVGRLAAEKQHDLIIDAVAKSKHRSHCQLRLVGSGPEKKRLERLAKIKGVQADIGPCSDDELLALYERCDLFIQASTVELEGMSALEAMAMACPVLLNHSKTSALHELPALPDAFFSDKDSSELTHRLDQFLDSASERSRHSAHNSAAALGRAHERSAKQLLDLYHRVAKAPMTHPPVQAG